MFLLCYKSKKPSGTGMHLWQANLHLVFSCSYHNPHFDVIYHLLLNTCKAMWYLFVKCCVDDIAECTGRQWRTDSSWLSLGGLTCQSTNRQNDLIWCNLLVFGSCAHCCVRFRIQGSFCLPTGKLQSNRPNSLPTQFLTIIAFTPLEIHIW